MSDHKATINAAITVLETADAYPASDWLAFYNSQRQAVKAALRVLKETTTSDD
jgi:hypothetical protein